jgi:cell cycle sensor histidine kinase DivJ
MAGAVIVSLFAFVMGAPGRACALAAALALAPAVVALSVASRWRETWAGAIAIDTFNVTSAAGLALTGGAFSPLGATVLIAPALALRLYGRARAAEAAGLAIIGYALAALTAAAVPATEQMVAPGAFSVLSIALVGWLLLGPTPVRSPVSTPSTALTRRFAEAAHELRTPLGHILGFAEIMQRRLFGPLPDKYGEYVDLIVDAGKRMNALASNWLDLGKLDAARYVIERAPLDLADVVLDAARDAESAARAKTQEIVIAGADAPAPFEADARALRQILDNLLSNAIKFTPDGGRIDVRLCAGPQAAIVDVEDTGPGISAEDKARLGRAFERGAGAALAEGTGLGLAVAIGLAQAHGGRLDALDSASGGALMRLVLPRV